MYFDPYTFASCASSTLSLGPARADLSKEECATVWLSLRDPQSSLGPAGWRRRFSKFVFGIRPPNQMADPRLEALRRFSVLLRLGGDKIARDEEKDFLAAGFTTSQMTMVRCLILGPSAVAPDLAPKPAALAGGEPT